MIKCIIIEDEHLARQKLELFVKQHHQLELVGSYNSAEQFLSNTENLNYELLFLDVGLPNMGGMDLASKIQSDCHIVFTTAYAEYAVEAFDLNAIDYLLKPFRMYLMFWKMESIIISSSTKRVDPT